MPRTINSANNNNLNSVAHLSPLHPSSKLGWDVKGFTPERVQGYGVSSSGSSGDYLEWDVKGSAPGTFVLEGIVNDGTGTGIDIKVDGVKVTDFGSATISALTGIGASETVDFGDGSDGAITRSISATESDYLQCTTYTIDSAVTMTVPNNGCVILATESITINGTLTAKGKANNGAAVAATVGVKGGDGMGGGGDGGDEPGFGSAGAAGVAGILSGETYPFGQVHEFLVLKVGAGGGSSASSATRVNGAGGGGGAYAQGGAGGNAGGSSASHGGHVGGSGGGFIILIAPEINIGASGVVDCDGENGGTGGTYQGGGGGGAGGYLALYYTTLSNSGTLTANGGAGGTTSVAGGAGGTPGNPGSNGASQGGVGGGGGGGGAGGIIISTALGSTSSETFVSATFPIVTSNPTIRLETTSASVATVGPMQLRKTA